VGRYSAKVDNIEASVDKLGESQVEDFAEYTKVSNDTLERIEKLEARDKDNIDTLRGHHRSLSKLRMQFEAMEQEIGQTFGEPVPDTTPERDAVVEAAKEVVATCDLNTPFFRDMKKAVDALIAKEGQS
jgi:hypothetical protein